MKSNLNDGAAYNSEVDMIVQQLIEASPKIAAAYECQKQRYDSRVAAAQKKYGTNMDMIDIKPYNVWFYDIFTGTNADDKFDVLSKNS